MAKDILIPHSEIADPNKITQTNARKFREAGLDIHKNEVDHLEDDFRKGVRRLKVRNVKYFDLGRRG